MRMGVPKDLLRDAASQARELGADYARVCGECEGVRLCLLLKLVLVDESYRVEPVGLSILMPPETVLDEKIAQFLKYTEIIRSRGGRVEFFIGKTYWPGAYGVACRSGGLANASIEIPEPEEVVLYEEDEA